MIEDPVGDQMLDAMDELARLNTGRESDAGNSSRGQQPSEEPEQAEPWFDHEYIESVRRGMAGESGRMARTGKYVRGVAERIVRAPRNYWDRFIENVGW